MAASCWVEIMHAFPPVISNYACVVQQKEHAQLGAALQLPIASLAVDCMCAIRRTMGCI